MKNKRLIKPILVTTLILSGCGVNLAVAENTTQQNKTFSPYVDEKGNITLPNDFRRTMVHLGSWYVPEGQASGFHDVYADGASVDNYRNTKKWQDGAVIVKELRPAVAGIYTTGKGVSHATNEIKQWFVMIKDEKNRFPSNASWGDGWGWALIKTEDTTKNASNNYKKDCQGCHVPAQKTDWIYVEGMPTLITK